MDSDICGSCGATWTGGDSAEFKAGPPKKSSSQKTSATKEGDSSSTAPPKKRQPRPASADHGSPTVDDPGPDPKPADPPATSPAEQPDGEWYW